MVQFAAIYWDSNPEVFRVPVFDWPILWYGVFFALGFAIGFPIFVRVLTRFLGKEHKKEAIQITDRLTLYVILGTVIGARIGHFLFYERPEKYLTDPLEIFRIWEGGLASHGGAVGIVLALILFSFHIQKSQPKLTWIKLLDLICIPAALTGFFIRMGNFVNQEILGLPTELPWGVVFAHPADHSYPTPRHPVVLYEAFFYLAIFFLVWRLSFKKRILRPEGRLIGLFLILVFSFRFLIEFFKARQSLLVQDLTFTMGQILSLPFIFLGVLFFYFSQRSRLNR